MLPHISQFKNEESGIRRVVEAYFKYLPQFDIELVGPDTTSYDVKAVHAGMTGPDCTVAHLHGIYFTADYDSPTWEYDANRRIVEAVRQAKEITVPSAWVAETFQRDMRFTPHIIPHGIEWNEWQHSYENQGFVLWNKNRTGDVCDPAPLQHLARAFKQVHFVSTHGQKTNNLSVLNGIIPHIEMKKMIQVAGVYLSTTKETFGLGILEAMAAGVPVLGWANGGNLDLVQHGVNGYLAKSGDYDDLSEGLVYCLKYRQILGENGRALAKGWTWEKACEKVAGVYRLTMEEKPATASIVIPVYNKTVKQVQKAVDSCLRQRLRPVQIVVVNDGSNDDLSEKYHNLDVLGAQDYYPVEVIRQDNQGVANARNNGIALTNSKYICCLDADDWLEPTFLEACISALEKDRNLGVAYTGLRWHKPDGSSGISEWPGDWDFDRQVNYKKRLNQIPTCCVFRRDMWERLGGYRQRYAPKGAGAEDAEFWTRAGAYGFKAAKVTEEGLFNYSWQSGQVTGDKKYQEADWLSWHPWSRDGQHPFASHATPKRMSHPVRQYDEPLISVIIPVGPGHEKEVINALDSLEAQTFRKWEVIVADDSGKITTRDDPKAGWLTKIYPYAKFVNTSGSLGAGYARNRGVEIARAPFLLFLDADDTLHPDCLQKMFDAWSKYETAIYTDYVGQAFITPEWAESLQKENRIQHYNSEDGEAIISYRAFDFDCKRALRQPEPQPYIWNLITTLLPKKWHNEIGGFDESMETWEDVDYFLRMVHAGYCFTRLPEELVRYRFYTGQRRNKAAGDTEEGRQKADSVIKYLREKYSGVEKVACGCKKDKVLPDGSPQAVMELAAQGAGRVADQDFVKAKFIGPRGARHIIGAFQFSFDPGIPSRRKGHNWVLYYGRGQHGYTTLVHKEDVRLMVGKWEIIPETVPPPVERTIIAEPVSIAKPRKRLSAVEAPEILQSLRPEPIKETIQSSPFDLQLLPGVTPAIAGKLKQVGLDTPERINSIGTIDNLVVCGMVERDAKILLTYTGAKFLTSYEDEIENHFLPSLYENKSAGEMIAIAKSQDYPPSDLLQILNWEKENKNRKTVIKAFEKVITPD